MKGITLVVFSFVTLTAVHVFAQSDKANGRWQVRTEKSKMDDSEIVTVGLNANEKIKAWLASPLPVLMIRCKEKKLEAFIDVGAAASVERGGTIGMHHVRLRFDSTPAVTQTWGQSTDGKALFALANTRSIVSKLHHTDTLVFEFTPFNASPAVATFDVRQFSRNATKLAAGCPSARPSEIAPREKK